MHLVILIIHFLLCAALILLILIQRSEGGGLGMGGGGGGMMTGRGAANLLTRTTAGLAVGFFLTSLILNVIVARGDDNSSVLDRVTSPTNISTSAPAETPAPVTETAPAPIIPDQE